MTREELKTHCERQIQQFERVEKIMPVTLNDWKRYEEHKLILELLEQQPILDKIRAEIEQLPTTKCTETHRIYIDADDFKKNVLVILDKYKAESEEEEWQI